MSNYKIIGISGVTCAGKTTLAQKLVQYLGQNCVLLSQDEFYRLENDPNHEWVDISPGIRHQNWESLSSIDWNAFIQSVNRFMEKNDSQKTVVIEGHLIFNYRLLSDLFQKKFFLTLDKNQCFKRRDERTYLPKDPDRYFDTWVWPMFRINFQQMKQNQNHIPIEYLDGSCDQNILLENIIKSLNQ